ncbi:transposase, MuDR, MULE transposase domain protein [Tanacetum coccineum]|uniref:Transposase, MuDR, MULE transposase domain protein n=1 Tax=Tanacetum coccineum TaxID=301880 RepID=A0ABQ4YDH0_9ASTR
MACSIPHSDDEIQALVQKQIDEDMVHQKAILDLALQFDNACTTKEDLRKAYEKYNHIPQRAVLRSTLSKRRKLLRMREDADFNSGAWVSAINYVNNFGGTVTRCLGDINNFLKKGKLEQVVAIVKSCSLNALGDLNVTLKDLSSTVPGIIHYKVLDVGSYENDITVGAAMILVNVSVFTPKPSKHYLNITKRNVLRFSLRMRFH